MTEFGMNQKTIRKTVFFLPLLCFSIVFPIVAADSPTIFSCLFLRERQREKMCEPYMENGKFTENSLLLRGSVRARPVCLCVCHGKVFNKSNTKPIKMLCRSEWCIHLLRIYTLYTLYAVCCFFNSGNNFRLIPSVFILCVCLSIKGEICRKNNKSKFIGTYHFREVPFKIGFDCNARNFEIFSPFDFRFVFLRESEP